MGSSEGPPRLGAGGSAVTAPGGVAGGQAGTPSSAARNASCDATRLLDVPDDPMTRGPWDVGVRTVRIGRLTAEVFYPGQPGSAAGQPDATYDLRDWLPLQERSKVPDANSPLVGPIGKHLYRDLPIDSEHGPYPVVVMIHGTASLRIASGSTNTHWASRGFVVIAADYPGLMLTDQLNSSCGYAVTGAQDLPGDVQAQLDALTQATGDLSFLSERVDMTRLGIAGHSQGACVAATLASTPNVQIVLPFTGSTPVVPSPSLKSILWFAGMSDTVIGYDAIAIGNLVCSNFPVSNVNGFERSPGQPTITKRLVGVTGGGHLVPTDLCQENAVGRNAVEEAQADGVCGVASAVIIGLPALFDCGSITLEKGIDALNYASTAALEETLLCKDRTQAFANMRTAVPQIGDFRHEP
jgi:pimeloyl-ACP methyl ester carboxylesterase